MKVGINARTFSVPQPDGAVQTAMKLTRELIANSSVELILFGHASITERFPDTTIDSSLYLPCSQAYGVVWERSVLPWLASKHDIDVLLCPNGNAPPTPLHCHVVEYIHDVNAQKGMSSGIHQLYRKTMVPLGARNSDAIVTVSEFSKREIVRNLPVAPDDVSVVYNGIDDFYLREGGSEPMELPDSYILYVGAMNPRKNVQGLIRAYQRLRSERDIRHKLVLIGPENKTVYKRLDIEDTDGGIITPGFIPKPQLKYAYEQADVFVYPSKYEGFGLPPLEAMACGTPVIASNATSLPEILGNTAALVDPSDTEAIADSISSIISHPEQDGFEPKNGSNHAQQFTWDRTTDHLMTVINQARLPN